MSGGEEVPLIRQRLPTRGALRLALDRQFGALFWGKLLSGTGIWIHSIVAAVVVYVATGSALWVGLVSIVQFTPQVFLTPISGTWADRGNKGRQIILGRLLCIAGSGSLSAFCFAQGDLEGYSDAVVVLAATLITGLGFAVGGPAQQSIIPLLIRPGELPTAMALNAFPMTLARVVGPASGAFIAAHYNPALAFAGATLTHLLFILLVLLAALPAAVKRSSESDFRVRTALRYVINDRTMLMLLISVAAIGIGSEPSITLAPTIADGLGGSAQLVGQLTGTFGLGAFLGFFGHRILSRPVRQQRILQIGLLAMALGIALVALAPTSMTVLAAFALAGVGFMMANTAAATLIQQRVPEVLRGRVMALWMVAFVGSRPLASALQGALADSVSVEAALLVTTAVLVAVLIAFRPKRLDLIGTNDIKQMGLPAEHERGQGPAEPTRKDSTLRDASANRSNDHRYRGGPNRART